MNTQVNKSLHLPLLAGGIVAILISGIAIGSLALSAQGSNGIAAPAALPEADAAPIVAPTDARAYKCGECGVIVSTRAIVTPAEKTDVKAPDRNSVGGGSERKPVRNYEITIRLRDGSVRVITDPNPAKWRHGERVKVIAGAD